MKFQFFSLSLHESSRHFGLGPRTARFVFPRALPGEYPEPLQGDLLRKQRPCHCWVHSPRGPESVEPTICQHYASNRFIYRYMYTCIYIYVYIYICVYIYIYVCMCIYIYIQVWQVFHVGGLMCNLEQQKLHLEIWIFSASVNSNVLSP